MVSPTYGVRPICVSLLPVLAVVLYSLLTLSELRKSGSYVKKRRHSTPFLGKVHMHS
jgi:hypothetical protein